MGWQDCLHIKRGINIYHLHPDVKFIFRHLVGLLAAQASTRPKWGFTRDSAQSAQVLMPFGGQLSASGIIRAILVGGLCLAMKNFWFPWHLRASSVQYSVLSCHGSMPPVAFLAIMPSGGPLVSGIIEMSYSHAP